MTAWDSYEANLVNSSRDRIPKPIRLAILLTIIAACVLFSYLGYVSYANSVRQQHASDLARFVSLYEDFLSVHTRAPRNFAEFVDHSKLRRHPPKRLFQMIREKRFVVIWDPVVTQDTPIAEYVQCYEVETVKSGGYVIFGDGAVEYVSASEFKKLPKFQTRSK